LFSLLAHDERNANDPSFFFDKRQMIQVEHTEKDTSCGGEVRLSMIASGENFVVLI